MTFYWLAFFILPSLISIITMYYFRKIDNRNTNLSRYKSLYSKLLIKFEKEMDTKYEYFESKFQNRINSFNEIYKNVEDLSDINNSVNKTLKELSDSQNVINKIDSKIYEVQNMDQNLNFRLESFKNNYERFENFFQKVQSSEDIIDNLAVEVRKLESALSENVKRFGKDFSKQMEAINQKLNQEKEQYIKQFKLEINNLSLMIQEKENILSTFEEKLMDQFYITENRFSEKMTLNLIDIEKNVMKSENELRDTLYKRMENISEKIDLEKDQIKNSLEKFHKELLQDYTQISEKSIFLEEKHRKIEEDYLIHKREFYKGFDEIKNKAQIELSEKSNLWNEKFENFISISQENLNSEKRDLRILYQDYEDNFTKKIDQFTSKIENSHQHFLNQYEDMETSLNYTLGIFRKDYKIFESFIKKLQSSENIINHLSSEAKRLEILLSENIEKSNKELSKQIKLVYQELEREKNQHIERINLETNHLEIMIQEKGNSFLKFEKELIDQFHIVEKQILEKINTDLINIEKRVIKSEDELKDNLYKRIEGISEKINFDQKKLDKQMKNTVFIIDHFMDSEKEQIKNGLDKFNQEMRQNYLEISKKSVLLEEKSKKIENECMTYKKEFCKYLDEVNDKIQAELSEKYKLWAEKFESFILSSQNNLNEEKKELKVLYHEYDKGFKEKLSQYNEKTENIILQFSNQYKKIENDISNQLKGMNLEIISFSNEMGHMKKKFSINRKKSLKGIQIFSEKHIESLKENKELILSEFKQNIEEYKHIINGMIEKLLKEKQNILDDFLIQRNKFKNECGQFNSDYKKLLEDKSNKMNNQFSLFKIDIENIKSSILKEMNIHIENSSDKAKDLFKDLENLLMNEFRNTNLTIAKNIDEIEKNYIYEISIVENKARKDFFDMDKNISESFEKYENKILRLDSIFDERFNVLDQKVNEIEEDIVNDMKNRKNENQKVIQFMENQIKILSKESDILNRADLFYKNLKDEINIAKDYIHLVSNSKNEFHQFKTEIDKILNLRSEFRQDRKNFLDQKKELIYISDRIENINQMSEKMETKCQKIHKDLEQLERFKHIISEIKLDYKNLEEKLLNIQFSSEEFNRLNLNFETMKSHLDQFKEETENIKSQIQELVPKNQDLRYDLDDLTQKAFDLGKNHETLQKFIHQFSQMDDLAVDIEKRIEQMNIFNRKLEFLEKTFRQIQKEADYKIQQLNSILKEKQQNSNDFEKSSEKIIENSNLSLENVDPKNISKNESILLSKKVIDLYAKGLNLDKIGGLLNLSKTEIKLILGLKNKK